MEQRKRQKKKMIPYENDLIAKLGSAHEIIIYGAGVMGKALMTCLHDSPYNLQIGYFLVEHMENNPSEIEGIPVIDLEHADIYKNEIILVALHEKNLEYAIKNLKKKGFFNLIPISFDSDIWSNIRWNWLYEHERKCGTTFTTLEDALNQDLHTYVVHSIADKFLKKDLPLRNFEIPIQVGAALTGKKLFSFRDDSGKNISQKNPQYCELTALYWIWKNDKSKYAGLSHYRRRFKISEAQAKQLVVSDVDVVVTIPVLNFPNVKQQYYKDHSKHDWDIMLAAIEELCPEYLETTYKLQNGIYYFAYNMLIARKEILNNYCEWLFPILFYCEEKIGTKNDVYQNRYIGFLAERLMTIYFMHNSQYKLVIAEKYFIAEN